MDHRVAQGLHARSVVQIRQCLGTEELDLRITVFQALLQRFEGRAS